MTWREAAEDYLICFVAAVLFAIAFVAIMCGDGDKGLVDLF